MTSVKAGDRTANLPSPLMPDTSLLQLHAQYVQYANTGPSHDDIHVHTIRMPAEQDFIHSGIVQWWNQAKIVYMNIQRECNQVTCISKLIKEHVECPVELGTPTKQTPTQESQTERAYLLAYLILYHYCPTLLSYHWTGFNCKNLLIAPCKFGWTTINKDAI